MKLIKMLFFVMSMGFFLDSAAMVGALRRTAARRTAITGAPRTLSSRLSCAQRTKSVLPSVAYKQEKRKSEESNKQSAWIGYAKYAAIGISAGIIASKLTRNITTDDSVSHPDVSKVDAEKYIKEKFTYKAPWAKQREMHRERLLSASWKTVSREYIDMLDKQAQELDKEFLALTQLSKDEYEISKFFLYEDHKFVQSLEVEKRALCKPLEGFYADRIKAWLKEFSFDLSKISILATDEKVSQLSVIQNIMMVNAPLCARMKDIKQFDVSVFHEFVHLMEDDSVETGTQALLLKLYCKDKAAAKAYLTKCLLFHEKRADLLAGLVNADFALALAQNMHGNANPPWQKKVFAFAATGRFVDFDKTSEKHPKNSERAAYLTELHSKMVAATAKKA